MEDYEKSIIKLRIHKQGGRSYDIKIFICSHGSNCFGMANPSPTVMAKSKGKRQGSIHT
ncbi:MAG: hypothetical protein ACLTQH_04060 [Fusobacterium sp.]